MKSLLKTFVICFIFLAFQNTALSGTVDIATLSPSSASIQVFQSLTFSATNDKSFDLKTYYAEFQYTEGLDVTNIVTTPSATKAKVKV
jgi:hypothetical protein